MEIIQTEMNLALKRNNQGTEQYFYVSSIFRISSSRKNSKFIEIKEK
jgi:hypothetical protein